MSSHRPSSGQYHQHTIAACLSATPHSNHSPLHVSSLCSPEGKDTVLDEDIQRHGINTLLVDNDETFWLFVGSNSLITNGIFELDNLLQSVVDKSSLGLDELLPLLGGRVEESRVDLTGYQLSLTTKKAIAYVFSYSSDTFKVRMKAFSTFFGISGCLAP